MRLRIGVGHPGSRELVTPYVLGQPDADDLALILTAINSSMEIITLLLEGSLQKVMNRLHKKNRQKEEDEDR